MSLIIRGWLQISPGVLYSGLWGKRYGSNADRCTVCRYGFGPGRRCVVVAGRMLWIRFSRERLSDVSRWWLLVT